MKDFDFDELDKAVSSVLGDSTDDQTSAETEADTSAVVSTPGANEEPIVEDSAEPPRSTSVSSHALHSRLMPGRAHSTVVFGKHPDEKVTPEENDVSSEVTSEVTEPEQPNLATSDQSLASKTKTRSVLPHRAGRFMDVVHPSSDMKRRNTPVLGKKPSVIPASPAPVVDNEASLETPEPEIEVSPLVEVPVPKVVNTDLEHAINQLLADEKNEGIATAPQVIETPTPEETPLAIPETTAPPTDAIAVEVSDQADTLLETAESDILPEIEETPAPSQSPFLSDAKVDKRPLGSQSIVDTLAETPTSVAVPASTDEVPAPPELASDLVALESVEAVAETTEVSVETEPVVEEVVAETPAPVETSVPDTKDTAIPDEKPEYSGPTSIPRQYKVEPRKDDDDDDTTAIFDTESYHQPIEHPPKKSHKWLWITLVLLIVAAIAGAGVYFWLSGAFVVLK